MNGDTSKLQKSSSKAKASDSVPVDDLVEVVIWTELGEERRAHSEHGTHCAGEEVITEHAEALIKNGFAKAKA